MAATTRADEIERRLREALSVEHLELDNESHMHSVGPGAQTHFRLVLVAPDFEGLLPVRRHQKVYALLNDLFAQGLHALALHTFTPAEWQARGETAASSPSCRGGAGK